MDVNSKDQQVIKQLQVLLKQGEDHIWRPVDAALALISEKNREIENLYARLSECAQECDKLRKELRKCPQ